MNTTSPPVSRMLLALVTVAIIGYQTLGRSFAHVGIAPLYFGEAMVLALVLFWPASLPLAWLRHAIRPSPLGTIAWIMLISGAYGGFECVRGILINANPRIALQNLVFHVYPFLFFTGIWVGTRAPDYLRWVILRFAWIHGVYAFLFITVFSPLGLVDNAAAALRTETISWAGQPNGAALAVIGVLSFEPRMARALPLLLLNGFAVAGLQMRAMWVGLGCALPTWSLLSGRTYQMAKIAIAAGVLFLIAWVTDLSIPSPATRGGDISARSLAGRMIAAVDAEWAYEFTGDAESYAATVSWRTLWWRELWKMVHQSPATALVGPGYGYPIWDHHPESLEGQIVRTPHNVWMYALSYTGWVGVAIYLAQQLAIGHLLWRVYVRTGQPFGICHWILINVWASFDNAMETPYFAIPFYLIIGLSAAPIFLPASEPTEAQAEASP